MGQLDLAVLKELDFEGDYTAMSCRWCNPFFSPVFVKSLRDEVLRNLLLVRVGIYELSQADILAINLLNDLCEYQLNKKLICREKDEN